MNRTTLFALTAAVLLIGLGLLLLSTGGNEEAVPSDASAAPTSTMPITTTAAGTTTTTRGAPVVTDPKTIPEGIASAVAAWETDWTRSTIDLDELLLGIQFPDPRDVIPPIDDPIFEDVAAGSAWLDAHEPGVLLEVSGTARFYPLSILTQHEIVNDVIAGTPVAITYCPLCNTAVAFQREIDGRVIRLGVSGLLRNSDLVMWDDATTSLWQQITGEGIVGEFAGRRLEPVPSAIVSWGDFAGRFPEGESLSPDTGFGRTYGFNPYEFYSSRSRPFGYFQGEVDDRYPALERVVSVTIGEENRAYPFSVIASERAVNDVIAGTPIVVLWGAPETADALDAGRIAQAAGIGTGVGFLRTVEGRELSFTPSDDDQFVDAETGSTWTLLGDAVAGPLVGSRLEFAVHTNEFWFAWAAFHDGAAVYPGAD